MKFRFLLTFLFLASCTNYNSISINNSTYNSKGFAFIYNEKDYLNKTIKIKLDNSAVQVAHNKLRTNTLIKIINPKTKSSIVVENFKKTNFSDFYKILITDEVARQLDLDVNLPLVEVIEIKKNKSFVAKKAKIFNEEKKISSNAPVTSVKISNISKNKDIKKDRSKTKLYILIGSFYSKNTTEFLKERIAKKLPDYDIKKLRSKKNKNNEIDLFSGPYLTVNLMKNDYILLKEFGFEELDIFTNE